MLLLSKFSQRGLIALSACCATLISALPSQAAISIESRDSTVVVDPFNLGFNPGFAVGTVGGFGPADLVLNSNGIDSSADLNAAGDLFYGPDNFNRVQSGTYAASQDFTLSTNTLGGALVQSSSVIADSASPSVNVSNELEVFFTVTADIDADLSILWAGQLNVGQRDRVRLLFQRVDSGGTVESDVISFYSEVLAQNSGGGDGTNFTIQVPLEAGQRYRIFTSGVADSGGSQSSQVAFTLQVPEPGSLALLSLGGLALLRRRR